MRPSVLFRGACSRPFFKPAFDVIFLPSCGLVFALADFFNGAQFVEAFFGCSVGVVIGRSVLGCQKAPRKVPPSQPLALLLEQRVVASDKVLWRVPPTVLLYVSPSLIQSSEANASEKTL